MSLDRSQVENIAMLARIGVAESEIENYTKSLNSILDLVDQLQAVDTTGVEPLANPLDATQRLRADVVTEVNQREKFQKVAPKTEAGLYLVPRVVE
ncbi:Asp-tRNA(Asn)/Glu-tRNA(Gln) amidotransferase subunit GatC [Salinibius halmophilus]|uniref:Asp-tRNA(Asn)/Glu-tRNA(Gln) amidotransferase subunit GatC n=1 Tax=Salinibius halmophilus TaxID=1853216 RepID=UPI000E665299|nr:Asp-tRNA(Asn)/Glu-tRNA(Gln) amidotransferase subunit GatC [Salinibius halmophilus]